MRLIFAGTPAFAAVALERLQAAGHEMALVLTQPDRPAGRGLKLQPSPVKQFALAQGMPLAQPRGLRLDGRFSDDAAMAREAVEAARADAMVVAAYGLILPQWALDAPRHGCLNIHASLLPRWRGAAPVQRAIEAGDARTGVTIMQMDAGLDTGDMLLAESVGIGSNDTGGSLHDVLATLGARLIVQALEQAGQGTLEPRKQPEVGVTYADKIDKTEAAVDWSHGPARIERKLRAFDPFPGATIRLGDVVIKLWRAEIETAAAPASAPPGRVLDVSDAGIRVACGGGVLRLTELQRPGARRMDAANFLRGFAVARGASFEMPGA